VIWLDGSGPAIRREKILPLSGEKAGKGEVSPFFPQKGEVNSLEREKNVESYRKTTFVKQNKRFLCRIGCEITKKLPFFGFFQIPQNSNRFYNTPARVTFFIPQPLDRYRI
jgi:hypothetical protein